jgi:hypothetical protein
MGAITCQVRAAGDGSVIGLSSSEAVSLKTSATTPFRHSGRKKVCVHSLAEGPLGRCRLHGGKSTRPCTPKGP